MSTLVVSALLLSTVPPSVAQNSGADLYRAAWSGQPAVVRSALARGAEVDLRAEDGSTPLFIASLAGHDAVVDILIEAGADVNGVSEGGEAPIVVASKYGFTNVAATLIEAGADVNATDEHGRTAYTWARWGENAELERLLMASGSDGSGVSNPFEDSVPVDRFEENPQLRKTGKIKMPKALKGETVTGKVMLRVIIDEKGKPLSIELLEGLHDELDANIVKSAEKWRFNPGEIQGRPVVAQVNAVIEFFPANQEGKIMTSSKRWRN